MHVKLISVTPDAEKIMAYCARVSSPHQDNPDYAKLLKYCIEHKHWSIFEMANMCVEIGTSRAIAQQILRHRSFHFQEFSQRYAPVDFNSIEYYKAREQDTKNRQNSTDTLPEATVEQWRDLQEEVWAYTRDAYAWALENGIAKECARFILPGQTKTKIYMNGTVRDWIHYINLRTANGTQKEHIYVAEAIKDVFIRQFPTVAEVLWRN